MSLTQPYEVPAQLGNFFREDFTYEGRVVIDATGQTPTKGLYPADKSPTVSMRNGRIQQGREGVIDASSESTFYDKYSFVLLNHKSKVKDWESPNLEERPDGGDLTNIYHAEVEEIIRTRLLPGVNLRVQQLPYILRRGPETPNPFFGTVVHNDYGLDADDFEENTRAFSGQESASLWRDVYDDDEVTGFAVINFWRTVYMDEPLLHLPLALLEPNSVAEEDLVFSGLSNFMQTKGITNQMSLRFNPDQRWYYFPYMTSDEVIAFRNFECHKDGRRVLRTCFHAAFQQPDAKEPYPQRQSCEYRVNVFFLKD